MRAPHSFTLSTGVLAGLLFIHKYRFLTIAQFARSANLSVHHSAVVLRTLGRRGLLGYFGFVSVPGQGKTPKVYFLKRKGFDLLQHETREELGHFSEFQPEPTWSPQMYHRLRILDLFIGLEVQVAKWDFLALPQTFLEYRRIKGTHIRETADYVSDIETAETRIVPDGVFILENLTTGRRGIFFLEMDMGTEGLPSAQAATGGQRSKGNSNSTTVTSKAAASPGPTPQPGNSATSLCSL